MAISNITVTYTSSGPVYTPSDWHSQSIYADGTLSCVDNTGEGGGAGWWLYGQYFDDPIMDAVIEPGETKTLAQAFPGQTLVGRYLVNPTFYGGIPIVARTTSVGSPKNLTLSGTLSREAVELSWDAGSAGTNNSVTGYDVQQRDSTDGVTFGSWETVSGSPVTGRTISVTPPETVGHYRQFRVRTRGSAGSSYYSGYVVLDTLLRRKWDAFGEWTDPTLTAKKSRIRAVLIAQIQERVNAIRAFYALQAYPFTEIVARSTHVSKWHILIGEIRSAIDEITTEHEGWFTLEPYKPRITHITQLRRIIDEM